jgi:hypothetical protein
MQYEPLISLFNEMPMVHKWSYYVQSIDTIHRYLQISFIGFSHRNNPLHTDIQHTNMQHDNTKDDTQFNNT